MNNDYFDSEEFGELLDDYEQQLENGETPYLDADDFADIADYYLSYDCPDEANEAINIGLELHPGHEELLIVKAAALIFEHKFKEARRCITDNHLKGDDILYQRAQLTYALDNDTEKAEKMFRQWMAKELKTATEDEIDELERDSYIHIISSFIDLHENFDISESFYDNEENLQLVRKWITEYIEHFQPLGKYESDITLIDICRHNKMADLLVTILTQILDEQPYLYNGWSILALAHFTLDQYEQAIEASDFALAIDPHDKEALLTRAYTHYMQGHKAEAAKYFTMYLNEPGADFIQTIPFADCMKEGKVTKEDAIKYLDLGTNAIKQKYNNSSKNNDDKIQYTQTLHDVAIAYQTHGELEKAEDCVRQILDIQPNNTENLFLLGTILIEQNAELEAFDAFSKAISTSNDYITTTVDVALTLAMHDYCEHALITLTAIDKLTNKKDREHHCIEEIPAIKSLIYLRQGKLKNFQKYLKQALNKTPDLVKTMYKDIFPATLDVSEYYNYAVQQLNNN